MRARALTVAVVVAAVTAFSAPVWAETPARTQEGNAYSIETGDLIEGSAARVDYYPVGEPGLPADSDSRVEFELQTAELEPGHAYTIWLMVFNHAENCIDPIEERNTQCGGADLTNPAAFASVMWGTGGVADGDGAAVFTGTRHQGDLDRVLLGPGLVNLENAEVHMIVRDHGPYDSDAYGDRQTETFNGGCPDPLGNDPGPLLDDTLPGRCVDTQTTGA